MQWRSTAVWRKHLNHSLVPPSFKFISPTELRPRCYSPPYCGFKTLLLPSRAGIALYYRLAEQTIYPVMWFTDRPSTIVLKGFDDSWPGTIRVRGLCRWGDGRVRKWLHKLLTFSSCASKSSILPYSAHRPATVGGASLHVLLFQWRKVASSGRKSSSCGLGAFLDAHTSPGTLACRQSWRSLLNGDSQTPSSCEWIP